ncbi:MAG: orotidine 5'-phosphate decarboxylase, partial [Phaeodactylibacter sp.]|nr:orotidine 5'-phosphate decarboxylase [Phaeodactylibacter sp.]
THPEQFEEVRRIAPEHFLLVPGIGAQGGDLQAVSRYGFNDRCGLLVNSSRGIIFAGDGADFADKARAAAMEVRDEMAKLIG